MTTKIDKKGPSLLIVTKDLLDGAGEILDYLEQTHELTVKDKAKMVPCMKSLIAVASKTPSLSPIAKQLVTAWSVFKKHGDDFTELTEQIFPDHE